MSPSTHLPSSSSSPFVLAAGEVRLPSMAEVVVAEEPPKKQIKATIRDSGSAKLFQLIVTRRGAGTRRGIFSDPRKDL